MSSRAHVSIRVTVHKLTLNVEERQRLLIPAGSVASTALTVSSFVRRFLKWLFEGVG